MPSRWTTATTRPLPRAREDPASFSVRLLFVGRATDPPLPSCRPVCWALCKTATNVRLPHPLQPVYLAFRESYRSFPRSSRFRCLPPNQVTTTVPIRQPAPGNDRRVLTLMLSLKASAQFRSRCHKGDNAPSQEFFQRSIDLDPTFAGGYRGLALAWFEAAETFKNWTLTTRKLPPRDWPAKR